MMGLVATLLAVKYEGIEVNTLLAVKYDGTSDRLACCEV